MVRICFVCLGNICRSPTAHGIMERLVADAGLAHAIAVDSAGTAAYHTGERADPRSRATASRRGVDLGSTARQFQARDFAQFDFVVAMDADNRDNLLALAPDDAARDRVHLMRDFDPDGPRGQSVPDPYYGGERGFDEVFDICDRACRGLLAHVRDTESLKSAEPRR